MKSVFNLLILPKKAKKKNAIWQNLLLMCAVEQKPCCLLALSSIPATAGWEHGDWEEARPASLHAKLSFGVVAQNKYPDSLFWCCSEDRSNEDVIKTREYRDRDQENHEKKYCNKMQKKEEKKNKKQKQLWVQIRKQMNRVSLLWLKIYIH